MGGERESPRPTDTGGTQRGGGTDAHDRTNYNIYLFICQGYYQET